MNGAIDQICKALRDDNAAHVRELLERHPELKAKINEPVEGSDGAVITKARSREMHDALLAREPNLAKRLRDPERRQLAHAARNNDFAAVRLMLASGLPVDARSQHGATPLHWAAWHGHSEMVQLLLHRHPPLEQTDADFHGTPLRWAIHGSENSRHPQSGNYAATVTALLEAGARPPDKLSGSEAVRTVLRGCGVEE